VHKYIHVFLLNIRLILAVLLDSSYAYATEINKYDATPHSQKPVFANFISTNNPICCFFHYWSLGSPHDDAKVKHAVRASL
jgi:hypothetical protein